MIGEGFIQVSCFSVYDLRDNLIGIVINVGVDS